MLVLPLFSSIQGLKVGLRLVPLCGIGVGMTL